MHRRILWYGWSLLAGTAVTISAILTAPGITYTIVAILAGLGFSVLARTTHRAECAR